MKITDLPIEVRPREKAKRFGVESLSDCELLALLIRSGVSGLSAMDIANELLATYHSMFSLANASLVSLLQQKGLKETRALNLLAVFEFHNRLSSPMYKKQESILSSKEIYDRYKYLESYDQEVLVLVMLDAKKRIIKEKMIYKGTYNNTPISLKEIITELLIAKAKKYYLIHNHPDDSLMFSKEDISSTQYIFYKTDDLDIELVDHVLITRSGYLSARENDILCKKEFL